MIDRAWLTARLTGLAVSASLESLALAVAMLEALPGRDISPASLMAAQRAREEGTEPPLRAVDPDAAMLGRVLALVVHEVERATVLHGRTFPGGWGPSGRAEDHLTARRAKVACDIAADDRQATFRLVAEEEIAEVFAAVAGTPEHARELCQVAAVYVRGLLVAMGEAVSNG